MARKFLPKPAIGRNLRHPEAIVAKLRQDLAAARAQLKQPDRESHDARTVRRMAELEEGQLVARGQALDAIAARSRAEAELRALQDALGKMPGAYGWLLRRAVQRLKRQ